MDRYSNEKFFFGKTLRKYLLLDEILMLINIS